MCVLSQVPLQHSPVLSCSKQKELKKTKTAPIAPPRPTLTISGNSPSILVSPPVEDSSTSPGPYFVKSLTTSMTLDRRKSNKKPPLQPLAGSISPRSAQRNEKSKSAPRKASMSGDHSPRLIKKNIPMSKSDPGSGSKRTAAPPVSKIALLSSFFERKAKEAAAGDKPLRFNLGWLTGRNRRPNL